MIFACAGFVADHVGEAEWVAERLEHAAGDATNDPQHFWLSGYNARTLATLKYHVWRGIILIEVCRATLSQINEVMFQQDLTCKVSTRSLAFFVG